MISTVRRRLAPAIVALATAWPVALSAQAQQNPACTRLEAQLQTFDRSAADPARAEQIRKFEDAAAKQQSELDRQEATSRRIGCQGNSFFVLFSGQPAQCGPLTAQIQQMHANLDRIQSDLARLHGASAPEQEGQRRAILVALSQNNCGAQYRAMVAAAPQPRNGGLFESLFGPGSIFSGDSSGPGGGYRTICVRTCDGFYYPISFATTPNRFADDARTCQRSCPAAEVALYSHRNPGEDVNQAVSTSGQLYTSLPNAFKYRQAFDSSCSCKRPGESWAQALKNVEDTTVERGDIVVNEKQAKQMSLPRVDAQGRPIKIDSRAPAPKPAAAAPPAAAATAAAAKPDPNREVRAVGPTFIPAR